MNGGNMALSYDILRMKERQIESLKEKLERAEKEVLKLRKENAEFRRQISWGIKKSESDERPFDCDEENCRKIAELQAENEKLLSEIEELKNENAALLDSEGNKTASKGLLLLKIPCGEKNLFENEIEDYLYDILYSSLEDEKSNFPANKRDEHFRKQDIIEELLEKRTFDWEKSETFRRLHEIHEVLEDKNLEKLKASGFTRREKCKNYPKYFFFRERYQLTFSISPRDGNASKQQLREIRKRCFLVSGNRSVKIAK